MRVVHTPRVRLDCSSFTSSLAFIKLLKLKPLNRPPLEVFLRASKLDALRWEIERNIVSV